MTAAIEDLRRELHSLIEGSAPMDEILSVSQQLDELIVDYCRNYEH